MKKKCPFSWACLQINTPTTFDATGIKTLVRSNGESIYPHINIVSIKTWSNLAEGDWLQVSSMSVAYFLEDVAGQLPTLI
jgi:hypothetical protein